MALEAVQAQAGHLSIESTRVYLHLTNDWLAGEYRRAASAGFYDRPHLTRHFKRVLGTTPAACAR